MSPSGVSPADRSLPAHDPRRDPPQWQWDKASGCWYRYDTRDQVYIYEDGERRSAAAASSSEQPSHSPHQIAPVSSSACSWTARSNRDQEQATRALATQQLIARFVLPLDGQQQRHAAEHEKSGYLELAGKKYGIEYKHIKAWGWTWVIHIGPITIRITFGTPNEKATTSGAAPALPGPGELGTYCTLSWLKTGESMPSGFRPLTDKITAGQLFTIPWVEDKPRSTRAVLGLLPTSATVETELEFVALYTEEQACIALLILTNPGTEAQTASSGDLAYGTIYNGRTPTMDVIRRHRYAPVRAYLDEAMLELRPAACVDYSQTIMFEFGFPVRTIGRVENDLTKMRSFAQAAQQQKLKTQGPGAGSASIHSRQDSATEMDGRPASGEGRQASAGSDALNMQDFKASAE